MKKLGKHPAALIPKAATHSNAVRQAQVCFPCRTEVWDVTVVFWRGSLVLTFCFDKKCEVVLHTLLRKDTDPLRRRRRRSCPL